jgi:predicted O-methyltransferase YrrM
MFSDIPDKILNCMKELESRDAEDRLDGTARLERLRQIPPETGRFLAILAASAPDGSVIEIGTSAGYSTLWLALACREKGRTVTTFELFDDKASLAEETFRVAQVEDTIQFVKGDALDYLGEYNDIAFCFLDAEKEDYDKFYDLIVPRMVTGGLLVADNVISHAEDLKGVVDKAVSDPRVDAVVVPIGKGELVCRKV